MKTVLIVEDDSRIVAALEIRFKAAGYHTLTAGDAAAGLSKALRHQPDLILLDISLPAGDGLQLGEKLKRRPETRRIPVIFVTANKDPDLRAKVMDLGAAGLFEKPYDATELLAVAGHALGETGTFRRPIARFTVLEEETVRQASKSAAQKILIIEDDLKIAKALALRLNAAGYEATAAHDALTGVKTAVELRPDLVLLDISMPAGDGFAVAEKLQRLLPTPVPLIFLTASKQIGLRQRAEKLGAVGYFEKPYHAEDLLTAVHEQLNSPGEERLRA
jgi:DNA-binding response OmpR family regulator